MISEQHHKHNIKMTDYTFKYGYSDYPLFVDKDFNSITKFHSSEFEQNLIEIYNSFRINKELIITYAHVEDSFDTLQWKYDDSRVEIIINTFLKNHFQQLKLSLIYSLTYLKVKVLQNFHLEKGAQVYQMAVYFGFGLFLFERRIITINAPNSNKQIIMDIGIDAIDLAFLNADYIITNIEIKSFKSVQDKYKLNLKRSYFRKIKSQIKKLLNDDWYYFISTPDGKKFAKSELLLNKQMFQEVLNLELEEFEIYPELYYNTIGLAKLGLGQTLQAIDYFKNAVLSSDDELFQENLNFAILLSNDKSLYHSSLFRLTSKDSDLSLMNLALMNFKQGKSFKAQKMLKKVRDKQNFRYPIIWELIVSGENLGSVVKG